MSKSNPREFTSVRMKPQCVHYIIEVIVPIKDAAAFEVDELDSAMGMLTCVGAVCVGAAEIVKKEFILDSFADACKILSERREIDE